MASIPLLILTTVPRHSQMSPGSVIEASLIVLGSRECLLERENIMQWRLLVLLLSILLLVL